MAVGFDRSFQYLEEGGYPYDYSGPCYVPPEEHPPVAEVQPSQIDLRPQYLTDWHQQHYFVQLTDYRCTLNTKRDESAISMPKTYMGGTQIVSSLDVVRSCLPDFAHPELVYGIFKTYVIEGPDVESASVECSVRLFEHAIEFMGTCSDIPTGFTVHQGTFGLFLNPKNKLPCLVLGQVNYRNSGQCAAFSLQKMENGCVQSRVQIVSQLEDGTVCLSNA